MCWVGLALSETPSAAAASTGGRVLATAAVLRSLAVAGVGMALGAC